MASKKSNVDLYNKTKEQKWSDDIQKLRLKWLGHMLRLEDSTPAKRSFKLAIKPEQRNRGRPALRWIDVIKKDLEKAEVYIDLTKPLETVQTLETLATDRKKWKDMIHQVCENV